MEEFRIEAETCSYIGQTLSEARLRSQSGALVLAIRRADRNLIVGPMGDTLMLEGDSLICLGTVEQLRSLNEILSPRNPPDLRLPNQKNSNLK